MVITYNGLNTPDNSISFTGIPNILKLEETLSGTKSRVVFNVSRMTSSVLGTEYDLVINGEKLISTNNIEEAVGNKFFVSNSSTNLNIITYKLCQALRSLTTLPINYTISLGTDNNGTLNNTIIIEAKEIGKRFNLTVSGSAISRSIVQATITQSTSTSSLMGATESKIVIDVYQVDTSADGIGSTSFNKGKYVTTLEKEFWGEECYFNLSPIFNSLVNFNELAEVNLYIYRVSDTSITLLSLIKDLYFVTGYSVNQGVNYIPSFTNHYFAQNVSRGINKGLINNTILYTYEPSIVFSLYSATNTAMSLTVSYISSAQTSLSTEIKTFQVRNNQINTLTINLNRTNFNKSFYIDITIPNLGTVRYNIIKPLNATDEIQRIYWTNSYGGVSFYDFTGNRTEQRKTSVSFYQKQLFDYYEENGSASLNKVYDKDVEITVTLTTHNIEKNGQWSLFDLQNSKNAWTEVNNKKYYITITDLKITETSVPDIYNATISYTYNTGDTF